MSSVVGWEGNTSTQHSNYNRIGGKQYLGKKRAREIREIKIMCCIAQLIETEETTDEGSGSGTE